jgi:predicted RNase H-like nuclease (RuvC/YqgF family)
MKAKEEVKHSDERITKTHIDLINYCTNLSERVKELEREVESLKLENMRSKREIELNNWKNGMQKKNCQDF